jgi:pyridoxine/pyridoxamine 5'-phosphate oxidase
MFFTGARSRKGRELRGNPHGSLALYWQPSSESLSFCHGSRSH